MRLLISADMGGLSMVMFSGVSEFLLDGSFFGRLFSFLFSG